MRSREFVDVGHANDYLYSSIISKDKRPIYIDNVREGQPPRNFKITYRHLSDKDNQKITFIDDKSLDMNPIPLGMVPVRLRGDKLCVYMSRAPVRMWKVGLTSRNTSIMNVGKAVYPIRFLEIVWSYEFEKAVMGVYPALEVALATCANSENNTVPVSRRFAVGNGTSLYYKEHRDAVGTIKDGNLVLKNEFSFLKEVAKEDIPDANH